jgi:hypothetical protein
MYDALQRDYTREGPPRTPRQPRDVCALCGRVGHEMSNCPRVVAPGHSRAWLARTSPTGGAASRPGDEPADESWCTSCGRGDSSIQQN